MDSIVEENRSDPATANRSDLSGPVAVADRVWWVGHNVPGELLQSHAYLIENGRNSVLVDPGSPLTIRQTLAKVEQIVPLSSVRYFICQHQDPDITAALPLLDDLCTREDAVIVTHWRVEALIRAYGTRLPYWRIEKNGWLLDLEDRRLRFVFTPYLHFAGAFCTFDEATGTLFSSDLFGGFQDGDGLYAESDSCLEAMRPFHEHYMPSRDILAHGVSKLAKLPIRQIAPQHGRILAGRLVDAAIEFLQELDCGLYLLAREDSDIYRLLRINDVLKKMGRTIGQHRDFATIATTLQTLAQQLLPLRALAFYVRDAESQTVLRLDAAGGYAAQPADGPAIVSELLDLDAQWWPERSAQPYVKTDGWAFGAPGAAAGSTVLLAPLPAADPQSGSALAAFHLDRDDFDADAAAHIIEQISLPLRIAVERETLLRQLQQDREAAYQRSIRDPLTGLYTREYMKDAVVRLCHLQDRGQTAAVGVVMIDIDRFKSINDRFGHLVGDTVLVTLAREAMAGIRQTDIPVRLGGEEFAIFCSAKSLESLRTVAERLRRRIEHLRFEAPMEGHTVTVSIGIAMRRCLEPLEEAMHRADRMLYRAKRSDRNRVVAETDGEPLETDATPVPVACYRLQA